MLIIVGGATAIVFAALAVYGMNRQIGSRRRAEADLDTFFNISPDWFVVSSFEGRTLRVNPAYEAALGYSTFDLASAPSMTVVHPDDRERAAAVRGELVSGVRSTASFSCRGLRKDGSVRWTTWHAAAVPARKLIFAVARDETKRHTEEGQRVLNESLEAAATERTRAAEDRTREGERVDREVRRGADQELRETADDLIRINSELETFTYSVSHDLKEPLRTLEAFSQFLLEDYGDKLDAEGKDYLTRLAQASGRMKHLIEDLLTISRAGRQAEPAEPVAVEGVIADIVEGMRVTVHERHATVDVPADLPEVLGDPRRIGQIFGNLISNGIKFNRGAAPRVEIGALLNDAGETVFFVRDNGIGIEPRYHEKIFGVFQRLHRREEFEGTGAGLAIVKRAVEALGGRIWVESNPGEGTTFLFTLPVSPAQAAATAMRAAA